MQTTLNKIREPMLCACGCGCGQIAPYITRSNASRGHVKGQQHKCISGHNKRLLAGLELLMRRVNKSGSNDCWIWIGKRNRKGYGDVQVRGVKHNAHRAVYIESGYQIPEGFHLDHLCRDKLCVNPAHMEPVTLAENVKRQHEARRRIEADAEAA